MTQSQQQQYAVSVRRGHGSLPIGLTFANLVLCQGTETIRIRFSLDRDKLLDLPLSAETLSELAHALHPFHRLPPDQIASEIDDLCRKGSIAKD